ncbi:hypothetical protein [Planococcus koreensis]|uniref:hypothetical protein n=1 Tax=Planococcus koreensis TaxID=112331 RepID=UPI001080A279|nr:hypothetical protein [Planococcus koreensis]
MDLSIGILYGAAVLALLFGCYLFLDYRRKKQEWKKKLKTWYPEEKRKSAISVWGDRFDESEMSQGLARKLKSANVNLLASEYIGMHALGILMFYVVFNMIFSMAALPSIILTAGILVGSHFLLFYIRKTSMKSD